MNLFGQNNIYKKKVNNIYFLFLDAYTICILLNDIVCDTVFDPVSVRR